MIIEQFDRLDSTSDEARRRARAGMAGPIWLVAKEQTGGRGRYGRQWISEPGNLYASLLLRPNAKPKDVAQISFVAAVAVLDALGLATGQGDRFAFKWPNDVLLDNRKLCGILLESNVIQGTVDWVIIGIGINIADHPRDIDRPATSLAAAGLVPPRPIELMNHIAKTFDRRYEQWLTYGFAPARQAWLANAAFIGKRISTHLASETISGIFEDLDEEGALVLRTPNGRRRRVHAGEIFSDS